MVPKNYYSYTFTSLVASLYQFASVENTKFIGYHNALFFRVHVYGHYKQLFYFLFIYYSTKGLTTKLDFQGDTLGLCINIKACQ